MEMENRFTYRAKSLKDGKTVSGCYLKFLPYTPSAIATEETNRMDETSTKHYILKEGFSDYGMPREIEKIEVDPNTIQQCVGLEFPIIEENIPERWKVLHPNQEYKRLLFEGDIVRIGEDIGFVVWQQDICSFVIVDSNNSKLSIISDISPIEIM